jgi:hypothetical protein
MLVLELGVKVRLVIGIGSCLFHTLFLHTAQSWYNEIVIATCDIMIKNA